MTDTQKTGSNHHLRLAAQRGDLARITARLEAGDALEGRHKGTGRTPLLEAVIAGQAQAVSLLLQQGGDVHACCAAVGHTALQWAVVQGHEQIARTLLQQGAAPDHRGPDSFLGHTSLMIAAAHGKTPLVRLLLEAGADPGAVDNRGGTALTHAESNGHVEAAAMLRAAGTRPAPQAPALIVQPWPELRWVPSSLTRSGESLPGDAAAAEIVRSYIVASHDWEVDAWLRSRAARAGAEHFSWEEALARAGEIRELHCTSRKRQYPRAAIGETPEWTPDIALIEVVQPRASRAELLLRFPSPSHFLHEYETVFVCLREHGLWRIDSARKRLVGTAGWSQVIL